MANYRRGGKRAYRGSSASSDSMAARTAGRILFFPLLFVYLELVLHLYMKMNMKYFMVYFVFALAAGCLFSAVTMPFKLKVNRVLSKVFAVLITLVYIIELIAKTENACFGD